MKLTHTIVPHYKMAGIRGGDKVYDIPFVDG